MYYYVVLNEEKSANTNTRIPTHSLIQHDIGNQIMRKCKKWCEKYIYCVYYTLHIIPTTWINYFVYKNFFFGVNRLFGWLKRKCSTFKNRQSIKRFVRWYSTKLVN